MGLDIRIPIGLLFGLIGSILVLAGLISNDEIYRSSLGVNVNLWWGLVMLIFGVVMIVFGKRGGNVATVVTENEGRLDAEETGQMAGREGESSE
jgi:hypothetical protein